MIIKRDSKGKFLSNKGINKKYNKYRFQNNICIVTINKDVEFIIDAEDYEKIKNICWVESRGYIVGRDCENSKVIKLHNYILGTKIADHINRNTLDNRKENLRECTQSQNSKNQSKPKNSTCMFMGVSFCHNKYEARIGYNKKKIHLGSFDNMEDAIIARLKAEKKYFGEFAPQKDLFKEYNI